MKLEFDIRVKCGKCSNEDKHHFKLEYEDDGNFNMELDNKTVIKKENK